MNLADVMDGIADQLSTIEGLRVFAYPTGQVVAPAAYVAYPSDYTYDATYGRGMDRMTLTVVLVVGKASDRTARNRIAAYVDVSGDSSVKQLLESATYAAFDIIRVTGVEFDVVTIGGDVPYMAAIFELDIAGSGSS
jgi:hypothetical protein